jgi:hypothetical protein
MLLPGDRIGQLIFEQYKSPPLIEVSSFLDTVRGSKGYGNTGMLASPSPRKLLYSGFSLLLLQDVLPFLSVSYASCGGKEEHKTPIPNDLASESSQHGYGQSERDRALLASNPYHLLDPSRSGAGLVHSHMDSLPLEADSPDDILPRENL